MLPTNIYLDYLYYLYLSQGCKGNQAIIEEIDLKIKVKLLSFISKLHLIPT